MRVSVAAGAAACCGGRGVGAGGDQVQWDPATVAGHGAFGALFARSTGLRPDTSPPQGDFVIDPSTARSERSSPIIRSYASSPMRSNSWPMPAWAHSVRRRRMVRSEQPGLARRSCAAVHQRGDHMVEHDPVWHPRRWQPQGWVEENSGRSADPISAANSTHDGSVRDAGSRGTDSPGDHQDFSNPVITCRRASTCNDAQPSQLPVALKRMATG
jgi:hypothetical protein